MATCTQNRTIPVSIKVLGKSPQQHVESMKKYQFDNFCSRNINGVFSLQSTLRSEVQGHDQTDSDESHTCSKEELDQQKEDCRITQVESKRYK